MVHYQLGPHTKVRHVPKEHEQDRFETFFKDYARTVYETGPVLNVVLDQKMNENKKARKAKNCFQQGGTASFDPLESLLLLIPILLPFWYNLLWLFLGQEFLLLVCTLL